MEARRVADRVAHFHLGELLEIGPTEQVFLDPRNPETRRFVEGKSG
jgi:phosphate transport system ATP-binding protein